MLRIVDGSSDEDNSLWSLTEMLRDTAEELEQNPDKATKAFIVLLDDAAGCYAVHFRASNIRMSEMLAACDALKASILSQMGY